METLLFLAGGIAVGILLKVRKKWQFAVEKGVMVMIWVLLLLLGVSIGANQEIVQNIHIIGWKALLLSVGGIAGSIACSYIVYLKFFKSQNKM